MEAALLARLEQLREQFRACAVRMEELDAAQRELREEMLRIAGAAQVLEELLAEADGKTADETAVAASTMPARDASP
jgi:hypothetical protein